MTYVKLLTVIAPAEKPAMQQILAMMMFAAVEMHMTDPGRLRFQMDIQREVATKYNTTTPPSAPTDPPTQYFYPNALTLENFWNMANVHDIVMILAGVVKKMMTDGNFTKFLGPSDSTKLTVADRQVRNDLISGYLSGKTISRPEYDISMSSASSFDINDSGDRLENYYIRTAVNKTRNDITKPLTVRCD